MPAARRVWRSEFETRRADNDSLKDWRNGRFFVQNCFLAGRLRRSK
jgi:hypothetical protein